MENCKDLIVQALYFNVSIILPTYNGMIWMRFPEIGNKLMFLRRLDKLPIMFKIHHDENSEELTITAI